MLAEPGAKRLLADFHRTHLLWLTPTASQREAARSNQRSQREERASTQQRESLAKPDTSTDARLALLLVLSRDPHRPCGLGEARNVLWRGSVASVRCHPSKVSFLLSLR